MSSEFSSIIGEVDAATALMDAERRRSVVSKITDLFTDRADRFTEDQVCAFDAVFVRLLRGLETEARAELARRLADVPNPPSMALRALAFDASGIVAAPVLQRSTRLSEDDLVHLAERRDRPHLAALAQRATLDKRVTEILVKRADRSATLALAENGGASFSDWAQASLVRRAASDPRLRAALEKRSDLSAAHRKRLTEVAEQQAERLLDDEFGLGAQEALLAGS